MEKLKMHSPDFTNSNIEKLAELFPQCVTEAKNEDGKLVRKIDFDLLRQELSASVVEGPQERYQLTWPGKREAILAANAPIAKTLRPCREESVDFDTTRNLFIEGDNLDALKLLQETYLGKIKMIYIDPPYNTGNDFIYNDDFAESADEYLRSSNQKDEEGNPLVANTQANGRFHSDWLSMMYPRLKLARNLLRDDGVIFVSIDDSEVHNLRKMCAEIFGENAIAGSVVWRRRQVSDNRNTNKFSIDHEYVLVIMKERASLVGQEVDKSKYANPDNDPRGPWMSDNLTGLASAAERPNLHYDLVNPGTGVRYPPLPSRGWAYEKSRMDELIAENRIIWPKNPKGRPRLKRFLSEAKSHYTGFSSVQQPGYTTDGTRQLEDLFGEKMINFPKPVGLIETLIAQAAPDNGDIILDFFSGSATTAHAVLNMNNRDGKGRRFILVQLDEPTGRSDFPSIADIGKERIRRAGAKIKSENVLAQDLDVGFRVLKVDTSNMQDVYYRPDELTQVELLELIDNIKPDRTAEDLLFQVLIDWGVDLTLPISRETIDGKDVYFVDEDALAACFEEGVTEELVKKIASRHPLRVVFRDAGFASDAVKINVEQIFKLLSPSTEVKVI